jgi:DNA-directed RNA polymerase beta' subunit
LFLRRTRPGRAISKRQLGDEQQARHVIDEFRREVERTRRAYAGIERRRTSLEKTFLVVEEHTKEALRQVRCDADKFVDST